MISQAILIIICLQECRFLETCKIKLRILLRSMGSQRYRIYTVASKKRLQLKFKKIFMGSLRDRISTVVPKK